MACIADRSRALNAALFEAEEGPTSPALLLGPRPLDQAILPDGLTWVVVFADGSSLDDRGQVNCWAPNVAREMRSLVPPMPLAA